MATGAHITPALFTFFRELAKNNEREWFAANKTRYEDVVKEPLLAFVADFAKPLRKLSPHFVADPRPVGGSLFRIHRDTRFSRDKSPYKTQAGIHFRHQAAKNAYAPGFYLHLEPGRVFVAAGLWHPEGEAVIAIRQAIADDPAGWRRCVNAKRFRTLFELSGDSLKRPPRGIDPDHPCIEDLKRKDFVALRETNEREACSATFPTRLKEQWTATVPLMRFLCGALELPC